MKAGNQDSRECHSVTSAEEEAVAGMCQCPRIIRVHSVVEELQAPDVAAIAPVEEQSFVAFSRIERAHDRDVGGEMHEALRIDRRFVEIDDPGLRWRFGVDGEARPSLEALIGADGAEGMAAGEAEALGDVDLDAIGHLKLGDLSDNTEGKAWMLRCCVAQHAPIM
jgi:hypothetical protein